MPRRGTAYEDTWVYKLIDAIPEWEFIDKIKRGSTTERLVNEGGQSHPIHGADLLENYKPDIVILQLGIVDCAPRYMKKRLEKIVNIILRKSVLTWYMKYVKTHHTRNPRNAYVLPDRFYANLREFCQRANTIGTKIIVIMIAPVSDIFINKNPYINDSINTYNEIYRHLSKEFTNITLVQPYDNSDLGGISDDGYHLNIEGHNIVFHKLMKNIK